MYKIGLYNCKKGCKNCVDNVNKMLYTCITMALHIF